MVVAGLRLCSCRSGSGGPPSEDLCLWPPQPGRCCVGAVSLYAPTMGTHAGPVASGRALRVGVAVVLPLRLFSFAAFQGIVALVLAVAGRTDPWDASVAWWPIVAVMTNLLTLAVVARLLRREGRRFRDLLRVDVTRVVRDLMTAVGVAVVSAVLVTAPNFVLATLLFGDAEAPLATFIQPLPRWAAVAALVMFPTTIALTELPTYFGYLQPRLEVLTGRAWVAVALAAGSLSLQHATLPLVFDWRFVVWRACMFLPLAVLLGITLRWRPRLLPYLAVLHGFADLQAALMIVAVAS